MFIAAALVVTLLEGVNKMTLSDFVDKFDETSLSFFVAVLLLGVQLQVPTMSMPMSAMLST
jgi:hypothetical protein